MEGIRKSLEGMMIIQLSGTVPLHNSDVASSGHLQGMVMMRKEMAKSSLTPQQAWLILISKGTRSLTAPWAVIESTRPSTRVSPRSFISEPTPKAKANPLRKGQKRNCINAESNRGLVEFDQYEAGVKWQRRILPLNH